MTPSRSWVLPSLVRPGPSGHPRSPKAAPVTDQVEQEKGDLKRDDVVGLPGEADEDERKEREDLLEEPAAGRRGLRREESRHASVAPCSLR